MRRAVLAEDKRDFRRYQVSSEINLIHQELTCRAGISNYSFNGIGAVMDRDIRIRKGDIPYKQLTGSVRIFCLRGGTCGQ